MSLSSSSSSFHYPWRAEWVEIHRQQSLTGLVSRQHEQHDLEPLRLLQNVVGTVYAYQTRYFIPTLRHTSIQMSKCSLTCTLMDCVTCAIIWPLSAFVCCQGIQYGKE
jgi:hypothetical protein